MAPFPAQLFAVLLHAGLLLGSERPAGFHDADDLAELLQRFDTGFRDDARVLLQKAEAQPGIVEQTPAQRLHGDDAHVGLPGEGDQLFCSLAVHEVERNLHGIETAGSGPSRPQSGGCEN